MAEHPSQQPDGSERGLVCRQCGCRHFWVLYTRGIAGGRLIRRRQCRHCGKRYTTTEKIVK